MSYYDQITNRSNVCSLGAFNFLKSHITMVKINSRCDMRKSDMLWIPTLAILCFFVWKRACYLNFYFKIKIKHFSARSKLTTVVKYHDNSPWFVLTTVVKYITYINKLNSLQSILRWKWNLNFYRLISISQNTIVTLQNSHITSQTSMNKGKMSWNK